MRSSNEVWRASWDCVWARVRLWSRFVIPVVVVVLRGGFELVERDEIANLNEEANFLFALDQAAVFSTLSQFSISSTSPPPLLVVEEVFLRKPLRGPMELSGPTGNSSSSESSSDSSSEEEEGRRRVGLLDDEEVEEEEEEADEVEVEEWERGRGGRVKVNFGLGGRRGGESESESESAEEEEEMESKPYFILSLCLDGCRCGCGVLESGEEGRGRRRKHVTTRPMGL